eukprot:s6424_g5.t1
MQVRRGVQFWDMTGTCCHLQVCSLFWKCVLVAAAVCSPPPIRTYVTSYYPLLLHLRTHVVQPVENPLPRHDCA